MRLLFSLFLNAGWIGTPFYTPVRLKQISCGTAPEHVRVWGWFHPIGEAQALVGGHLESGSRRLRVEGTVFDWRPQRGRLVEMWGQLEPTATGYRLRFHNGRNLGEARRPRPTPTLQEGVRVRKVSEAESQPFSVMQGTTEDWRAFLLPNYGGALGACPRKRQRSFSGTVGRLASNFRGR